MSKKTAKEENLKQKNPMEGQDKSKKSKREKINEIPTDKKVEVKKDIKESKKKLKKTENKTTKIDKKAARLLGLTEKKKGKQPKKPNNFLSKVKIKAPSIKLKKNNIFSKMASRFLDSNEKQVKKLQKIVDAVRVEEEKVKKWSQKKIQKKVKSLRDEFQLRFPPDLAIFKEKKKAWLDSKQGQPILDYILEKLPITFALISEATFRTTGKRLFDVQLMAGTAITQGRVIEFKTGEGKTYVAPLALFVYSLFGRGSYLVTVNEYLAKAHGEYIGNVMDYLGVTVGVVIPDKSFKFYNPDMLEEFKSKELAESARNADKSEANLMTGLQLVECSKKEAYECDVVYATHAEMGFDYLRDNMQKTFEDMNQREPFFAIIDEVDSILIDEARTPLIISDSAEESNILYKKFATLVKQLEEQDYVLEEKEQSVTLSPSGVKKMEKWLKVDNIWADPLNAKYLDRALLAEYYYKRDDQYVVQGGEIVIVDEFTGRLQPGRRYSHGIHQALEAKEGLEVKKESRTLATVTYQNYFRLFPVLSGMTGTALTESEEFGKIYNLDVISIPTNKPLIRKDKTDKMYKNEDSKFRAIIKDIEKRNKKGQPILVGTVSVEKSEKLSQMLTQKGIKHEVLNAKNHSREAKIVADAGKKYAVTISTNMAGRGTDIRLGEGVAELGGLYVIGTERHESRRIDNQLRGRSGRQGDPGESLFYLALDDEIMRMYGGDQIKFLMNLANVPDDLAFESRFISRTIRSAQRRVEAENFNSRKHLVDFDDVANKQRIVIYNRRKAIIDLYELAQEDYRENKKEFDQLIQKSGIPHGRIRLRDYVNSKIKSYTEKLIDNHFKGDTIKKKDLEKIVNDLLKICIYSEFELVIRKSFKTDVQGFLGFVLKNGTKDKVIEQFNILIDEMYDYKERNEGFVNMRQLEKYIMLDAIDRLWIDHLEILEDIRYSSEVMSYGQKDPLNVYQNEGYQQFCLLMDEIDSQIAGTILLSATASVEKEAERLETKSTAKKKTREAQELLEKLFREAQTKSLLEKQSKDDEDAIDNSENEVAESKDSPKDGGGIARIENKKNKSKNAKSKKSKDAKKSKKNKKK